MMNPLKYDEMIDKQIKKLTPPEKKEVFDFVEFLQLKRLKKEDVFIRALKETQAIGKQIGVTEKDIEEEIKSTRTSKHG